MPKTDRLVLPPLPEANARVNALQSGQHNWIEAPPPDGVPQLRGRGFRITSNAFPHTWPWQSPFGRAEASRPGAATRRTRAGPPCRTNAA